MTLQSTSAAEVGAESAGERTGSVWALILLTLVYGLSIVDRSIFGLLLQPIKQEFQFSDTMLGLIGSVGFAFTYALAGLPLSRLADRLSRKKVVALGLATYSVITALTGTCASAFQLATARVGLAIGEAAVLPAATALISDYYPRKSRARAMGVLGAGPPLATLFGFSIAGAVSQSFGWRGAYVSVGMLGLILAVIVQLTMTEPRRGQSEETPPDRNPMSLSATLIFLSGQRCYVLLIAGAVLMACTMASLGAWGPAFLGRIHHLAGRELGFDLGLIAGIGGIVGTLTGGFCSDLLGRNSFKWKLLVPAFSCLLAAPSLLLFLFAPSIGLAFAGLTLCTAFVAAQYGALFATLQSVVKVSVRAFSVSVFLVFTTVIGVGLGPLAVGIATDRLTAEFAQAAIRYSMLIPTCSCFMGGLLILLAIRFVDGDLNRVS
jgi:predicted MFS family arabinose efflux permease